MTATETMEVRRNTGKDVLTYVSLAAVAVLSAVIYLWISFSPPHRFPETVKDMWDLSLSAALPLEEADLKLIRSSGAVGRAEPNGDAPSTAFLIWVSGTQADRASYEEAVSAAEAALQEIAVQREQERVKAILDAFAASAAAEREKAASELAALAPLQEKLDAEEKRLNELRRELDEKREAAREAEAALSGVQNTLALEGQALDEEEVQLSTQDGEASAEVYRERVRHQRQQRDLWFAGGENYLDARTLYEREKQVLERTEESYAAAFEAYEAEKKRLEDTREALEAKRQYEPEPPAVEDCTWQLGRNSAVWAQIEASEQETVFSPVRLSLQMLFLAVAALSAWLFFARLLSSAAGRITKPRPEQMPSQDQAHADERSSLEGCEK